MEQSGEELPDFLKIPKPLQERFFKTVEEEVDTLIEKLSRFSDSMAYVKQELAKGIYRFEIVEGWKELSVAVVDGSDVQAVDDRIGLRYGLYAVAYKLFKGLDPVDNGEGYFGDRLPGDISMNRESFLKILDLITTYSERLMAKTLLDTKKIDLLIIDGSFFGYRAGCSMVKNELLHWTDPLTREEFVTVYDLIKKINDLTLELLLSGKAVGVIKRVPTTAIDGYLCYKYGFDKGVKLSDRSILSLLMNKNEIFDYQAIFGTNEDTDEDKGYRYDIYTWFRQTARDASLQKKSMEEILKEVEKRVKVQLVADLTEWSHSSKHSWKQFEEYPIIKAVRSTRRIFMRTVEELPPICVEIPENFPEDLMKKTYSYIFATANPATALPLSLDLVDELVSLPRGLAKEFINEIEAALVRKGISKENLLAVFSRYNPQKDEL